jgi:hypothetical protein
MQRRQGWLFPVMVVAAAAVIVFGCIGIAGITSRMPVAPATGPLDSADIKPAGALQNAATTSAQDPVTLGSAPIVRN